MIGPVIDRVKEILEGTSLVRRVAFSDPDEFLTYKTNFFPAAHIDVTSISAGESALIATFQVIVADTNDEAEAGKTPEKQDQLKRSLDTTLTVATRLVNELKVLLPGDDFRLVQDNLPSFERVFEQGEQDYYGWVCTFQIELPNTIYNA